MDGQDVSGPASRVDALLEGGDLKPRAVDHTVVATCTTVIGEDAPKIGYYGRHEVHSDEPPTVGGRDEYPPPLGYAALAVGL